MGSAPTYAAGFRRALSAGAGLVLEMDSDFSHDPAYLRRLLEAADRADLVIGSRFGAGGGTGDWSALCQAISRGGGAHACIALGSACVTSAVASSAFAARCWKPSTSTRSGLAAFQVELTYRAIGQGFEVVEVPIVFRDRRAGDSKMGRLIVAEAIWRVPLLRVLGPRGN